MVTYSVAIFKIVTTFIFVTGCNSDLGDAMIKLEWRSDLREMTYEIALVSATKVTNEDDETVDNVFASFEITLVIEDLLTLTTNDVTVNCYKGNVEGKSANIVAGVNLVDAAGNTAYNPYALNVDQIWNGYEVKVDANGNLTSRTIKPDTFFNAYGQSFKFDENVKAFIGEEDVTASVHPAVSADGTVTLNPQSGAIQKAVTVKVPVKVTYTYDEYGVQAETATVNVVFNPTTTVEEDAPVVDATFETPAGQFIGTIVGDATKTPYLFDFATATVNAPSMGISFTPADGVFTISNMNMSDPDDAKFYFIGTECSKINFVATSMSSGTIDVKFLIDPTTGEWTDWNVGAYAYSNFTGTTLTFDMAGVSFELTKVAADNIQKEIGEISFGPIAPLP